MTFEKPIIDAVSTLIREQRLPGCVVTVVREDLSAWTFAAGLLDTTTGEALREDSIFRIYSMTKPVVSVAALMLCQENLLRLDEPIATWLPEFREMTVFVRGPSGWTTEPARRPILVRDLLRHTAGFGYGTDPTHAVDQMYRERHITRPNANLEVTVRRLAELPLKRHPGEQFHYGYATDVLGRLLEVAEGRPLDVLLHRRLFQPLRMLDTGFQVERRNADRLAALHRRQVSGPLEPIEPASESRYLKPPVLLSGGAGLLSTAGDYAAFVRLLMNQGQFEGRQLLDPQWLRQLTTNQLPGGVREILVGLDRRVGCGFGLGVYVRVETSQREPESLVGDYGWSGSGGTHYWTSPRRGLSVIAMSQYLPYSTRLKRTIQEALGRSAP